MFYLNILCATCKCIYHDFVASVMLSMENMFARYIVLETKCCLRCRCMQKKKTEETGRITFPAIQLTCDSNTAPLTP